MLGNSVSVSETANATILHVDTSTAAQKIGIATAGAAYGMTSFSLNDLVAALTALFVLLQIGLLIPKYYALIKAWRKGKKIEVDVHE